MRRATTRRLAWLLALPCLALAPARAQSGPDQSARAISDGGSGTIADGGSADVGSQTISPGSSGSSQTISSASGERFSLHFQATIATQAHPAFNAAYSGAHSLSPGAEAATSIVTDLFAGARLWSGAEAYLQPELAGGRGLSSTEGIAAFPSGEVYRVGDPEPTLVLGRVFLRQRFDLGGEPEKVEPGPNQLGGTRATRRLTITLGKVSTTDFVDNEPLSNDPHTRFESWGLFASGAYDYAADTRGYTWGVAAELTWDWWSLRAGMFLEPKQANGLDMEWDVTQARALVLEGEARYSLLGRKASTRLLVFVNDADMGDYSQALAQAPSGGVPDVTATRQPGRIKYGFAASGDLQISDTLGAFARASWDDGHTETWAFTEIDRSLALGLVQSGAKWHRDHDELGAAIVVSGLSGPHRAYLAAGGLGFIIGDGGLDYASELLGELYYSLSLIDQVSLIGTWQPVIDPAYNAARGPVSIFTARVHIAF